MARTFDVDTVHDEVMWRLDDLGAWTYHTALTGSRYVKFRDRRLGSLRIADHVGRRKYNYRWNVWLTDPPFPRESERRGIITRHFRADELADLEEAIRAFKWQVLLGLSRGVL